MNEKVWGDIQFMGVYVDMKLWIFFGAAHQLGHIEMKGGNRLKENRVLALGKQE